MSFRRFLNLILGIVYLFTFLLGAIKIVSANAAAIALKIPENRLSVNSSTSLPLKGTPVKLPVSFIPNRGQIKDNEVKFQASNPGGGIFFKPGEFHFVISDLQETKAEGRSFPTKDLKDKRPQNVKPPFELKVKFQGFNQDARMVGTNLLPGKMNYFIGNNPADWINDLETFDGIMYPDFYSGIKLMVGSKESQIKTSFVVASNTDPAAIQWKYQGATDVSLDNQGNLLVSVDRGGEHRILKETAPIAWQEINRQTVWVPVVFKVDQDTVSFLFPNGYDVSKELTIDPTIEWATYLGGNGTDQGTAIARDSAGNIVVGGFSYCINYPLVDPYQGYAGGSINLVVSKLDPTGTTLLSSTCLGGPTGYEKLSGLALDTQDNIVVSSVTNTADFPIVNGIPTFAGGDCGGWTCYDFVVAKLNAAGNALLFSSYLGGTKHEDESSVAVGPDGNIYLAGLVGSDDFPTTTNAYARTRHGSFGNDIGIAKINPTKTGLAALEYSTYLGGNDYDGAFDIKVDNNNIVYIAGYTYSWGGTFPQVDPVQPDCDTCDAQIILAKLDLSKSGNASLVFSTKLGGSGTDIGLGLAIDNNGNAYITGYTKSGDFASAGAFQTTFGGGKDAFVMKVDTIAKQIRYKTYLGGSADEEGASIVVDNFGKAYVAGYTYSTNYPTINPSQARPAETCGSLPCQDGFVSVLNPEGSTLLFSTYLGGGNNDVANGIIGDVNNNIYVVGTTWSSDFSTTPGSYDTSNVDVNGYPDIFIVKFGAVGQTEPTPTPTVTLTSTPTVTPTTIAPGCISNNNCDLDLTISEGFFTVGKTFNIQWNVANTDHVAQTWQFHLLLPTGISPSEPYSGSFNEQSRTYDMPVLTQTGTIQFIALGQAQDSDLVGELRDGQSVLSTDTLHLVAAKETHIDASVGGTATNVEGDLIVSIPAEVLPSTANVSVVEPLNESLPAAPGSGSIIQILAKSNITGEEIHQLNTDPNPTPTPDPTTIIDPNYDSVHYADPILETKRKAEIVVPYDPTDETIDPSTLFLYSYDEETGLWAPLPSVVDTTTNTLHAWTDHFSLFSYNSNSLDSVKIPPLDAAQTSEFTGSASYSLPIEVIAGPAGVVPSIGLSYNSQSVEGVSPGIQGGWAGMGWDVSAGGSIIRNTGKDRNQQSDDTFSLIVGGTSMQLVAVGTGSQTINGRSYSYIEFRSADENYWVVRRYLSASQSSGYNTEEDWWVGWDKIGTKYTFNQRAYYGENTATRVITMRAWGWFLSEAEYANGQKINYAHQAIAQVKCYGWDSSINACGYPAWSAVAVYLRSISYDYGHYKVIFNGQARPDSNYYMADSDSYVRYDTERLKSIQVLVDNHIIREYSLSYFTDASVPLLPASKWTPIDPRKGGTKDSGRISTLQSVTECGVGGCSVSYNARPPITFTYGGINLDGVTYNQGDFMHLSRVDNGEGGSSTFSYETSVPFHAEEGVLNQVVSIGGSGRAIRSYPSALLGSFSYRPGTTQRFGCNIKSLTNSAFRFYVVYDNTGAKAYSSDIAAPVTAEYEPKWTYINIPSNATKADLYIEYQSGDGVYFNSCYQIPVTTQHRVVSRMMKDQVSGTKSRYDYSYEGAAVNDPFNSEAVSFAENKKLAIPAYSEFRGHSKVTVSQYSVDGTGNITGEGIISETLFHQNDWFKGRAYQVSQKADGKLIRKTNTTWEKVDKYRPNNAVDLSFCAKPPSGGYCYSDRVSYFVYSIEEISRQYGNFGESYPGDPNYVGVKKTYPARDAWGNTTKIIEWYWTGTQWGAYRTTRIDYPANVIAGQLYLTGLIGQATTYKCSSGGACESENYPVGDIVSSECSMYGLSSATCGLQTSGSLFSAIPQSGILYAKRTLLRVDTGNIARYSDKVYSYDAYGNLNRTTSYPSEGSASALATGNERISYQEYDPTFHTRLVKSGQVGPNGSTIETQYVYSLGTNGYWLGLPTSEVDANASSVLDLNHTASAVYDTFGRILTLRLPLDGGDSNPAYRVSYSDFSDSASPASVTVSGLFDTATLRYTSQKSEYSGMGQKLQTVQFSVPVYTGTPGQLPTLKDILINNFFDAFGRDSGQTIPYTAPLNKFNARRATKTYNVAGQLIKSQSPSDAATVYAYDVKPFNGMIVSESQVTDPAGRISKTYKDPFNRVIRVLQPDGKSEIRYTYDEVDHLISISIPNTGTGTNVTDWFTSVSDYDLGGRKISMTDPDMGNWTYAYDALGNQTKQYAAAGNLTCTLFDVVNRPIAVIDNPSGGVCPTTDPDTGQILNVDRARFLYDQTGAIPSNVGQSFNNTKGKLTTAIYKAGATYTSYTDQGQIADQWTVLVSPLGTYHLGYSYYLDGKMKAITYPSGEIITIQRDAAGRPIAISRMGEPAPIVGGDATSYDEQGRQRYLPFGTTGLSETHNYYEYSEGTAQGGRLKSILMKSASNVPFLELTYEAYYESGSIKKVKDSVGAGAGQSLTYGYDSLDRLTSAIATDNGQVPGYNQTFHYDEWNGLITSRTDNGVEIPYAFDPVHPKAVKTLGPTSSPIGNYQYDPNGNMTQRTENGVTYNQYWTKDGKLKGVCWDSDRRSVAFAYDSSGNRILRVEKLVDGFGRSMEMTTVYVAGIYEKQLDTTSNDLTNYLTACH